MCVFLLHTSEVSRPFPGSKTARKSVLHFKTLKKDYQQEADLELVAKTWRVRISLGSKVYANDNQVVIAIRDNGSYDFKEDNFGSFSCSYSSQGSARVPAGWLGSPKRFLMR